MPFRQIIALAAILAAGISQATAQGGWPTQGGPNSSQGAGWPTQQPQQTNPCTAFLPYKDDAEQTVAALGAAQKRKAAREEFCQLFTRLTNATGKMAKFFEVNKQQCNIPAQAIQQVKAQHTQSLAMRKQACSQAPAAAATPSLSDVLGGPILPESSSTRPSVGTFNTLTGNPLTR